MCFSECQYYDIYRCLEEMKSPVMLHPLMSVLFGTSRLAELDPRFSSHLVELSCEVGVHGNVVMLWVTPYCN